MKTYQVTLNDESAALVDKMLQDGPWESIDELFLNSIGTLQEDVAAEEELSLDYEEVKRKLQAGIDSTKLGESNEAGELLEELLTQIAGPAVETVS